MFISWLLFIFGEPDQNEVDAMKVTKNWPFVEGLACKKTKEKARANPLDRSIIGCLKCNFWTRYPLLTGHFYFQPPSPRWPFGKLKGLLKTSRGKLFF